MPSDDQDYEELDSEFTPNPEPGPLPPGPLPPDPGVPKPPRAPSAPIDLPVPRPPLQCLRLEPVSGRYEGGRVSESPLARGRSVLDLRVDVDRAYAHSRVMNRVSADLYSLTPALFPFQPGKLYRESWIIDDPVVSWRRCEVVITGTVRWWQGTHPQTQARIVIPWRRFTMGPATVELTGGSGAAQTYVCAKRSPFFRAVELEVDLCASVDSTPLVPDYDTHAHSSRPINLPQRTLTIEESYREAGVDMTISQAHTSIDDSDARFASWSPAELHDAMEQHYSRFAGRWPAWRMWGLLAGLFENAGVGGIMFDAASAFGGAGEAPERQGFAVFRNHSWFNDLPDGAPSDQAQAWAARHFLYTWVHEAGHAFNFLHSWNKNRADSLSWMNYDWRFNQVPGAGDFWSQFEFSFDDEELIHLRHGDRSSVIMGGDPWSSGGHLEGPPAGSMAQLEGASPVELLLRAKRYFEFMEPVSVELRLRNLLAMPLDADVRLTPEAGATVVFIQRPDGRIVRHDPIMCHLGLPEVRTLAPAGAQDGADRHSASVFLGYASDGFGFDVPGRYRIRAVYQGLDEVVAVSNALELRVGVPVTAEQDRLAQDYFSDAVGISLYLGGSPSPFLADGMDTLREVAEREPSTMLGARAAEAVAGSVAEPFFRLDDVDKPTPKLVPAHEPQPEQAVAMTEQAVEQYRSEDDRAMNLPLAELALARSGWLTATGDTAAAKQEIDAAARTLESRGVKPAVVDRLRAASDKSGEG